MSNLVISKPHSYITALNWIGWPLVAVYFVSMFAIPAFQTSFDWNAIQNVWDRWQSLNVGMLAFVASIIAFNISRYNAEQERKRNFVAARAFLPEALSELTDYCKSSIAVFAEAWPRASDPADRCRTPLETPVPDLPSGYRSVFQECIKTASPQVGDRLAYILMRLQIHHSRMQGLAENFSPNSSVSVAASNVISYLYCIAEIQALINQLYEYARGERADFNDTALTLENYDNAIRLADTGIAIRPGYTELMQFIERAIARGGRNEM